MKKMMISMMVFGSMTCFAQQSEFERGFYEGKRSCEDKLFHCIARLQWSNVESFGPSRAAAISELLKTSEGRDAVGAGRYSCREI